MLVKQKTWVGSLPCCWTVSQVFRAGEMIWAGNRDRLVLHSCVGKGCLSFGNIGGRPGQTGSLCFPLWCWIFGWPWRMPSSTHGTVWAFMPFLHLVWSSKWSAMSWSPWGWLVIVVLRLPVLNGCPICFLSWSRHLGIPWWPTLPHIQKHH